MVKDTEQESGNLEQVDKQSSIQVKKHTRNQSAQEKTTKVAAHPDENPEYLTYVTSY
ncbi:hypothetical protein NC653_025754 [Populus alba x Populus x berolinensis]|uniref:Uncharacterized protein n=1 Tax=Populus alba x Populus x berolinensis TaxID=444605 RepID=A0AAD6Q8G2_9ROSI|nr:hypothetical protein NC653_025754 [Populus alba x Populus x berolinensis]